MDTFESSSISWSIKEATPTTGLTLPITTQHRNQNAVDQMSKSNIQEKYHRYGNPNLSPLGYSETIFTLTSIIFQQHVKQV